MNTRATLLYGDILTRRHFVQVAETIASISDPARRREETDRWVPMLKRENPRFDEARFRAYVEETAAKRTRPKVAEYATGSRWSRRPTRGSRW